MSKKTSTTQQQDLAAKAEKKNIEAGITSPEKITPTNLGSAYCPSMAGGTGGVILCKTANDRGCQCPYCQVYAVVAERMGDIKEQRMRYGKNVTKVAKTSMNKAIAQAKKQKLWVTHTELQMKLLLELFEHAEWMSREQGFKYSVTYILPPEAGGAFAVENLRVVTGTVARLRKNMLHDNWNKMPIADKATCVKQGLSLADARFMRGEG